MFKLFFQLFRIKSSDQYYYLIQFNYSTVFIKIFLLKAKFISFQFITKHIIQKKQKIYDDEALTLLKHLFRLKIEMNSCLKILLNIRNKMKKRFEQIFDKSSKTLNATLTFKRELSLLELNSLNFKLQ